LRYGVEEALQWLYKKKLMHLESEANLIREQLLQESLAMRRSLELSSIEPNEFASSSRQKCAAQLENFHSTLKELSDP
jgi:predicted deacetylase